MRRTSARAVRATVSAASLAVACLAPSPARAQSSPAHELRHDVALDLTVTLGAAGLVVASELIPGIKPRSCRWCDRGAGGDSLNGLDRFVRRSLVWSDPQSAHEASNVTAFLLVPAAATLDMVAASTDESASRALPVDALIISEAVTVSMLLTQTTKLVFARERPFVHHMPEGERAQTASPADNNVSFASGHTSLAFAIAAASGTVATLRGYRLMPLVWGTLMPLAGLTGYLRIAADKHYFTDVVTGMLIGSAAGVVLPLVFHGRQGDDFVPDGTTASSASGLAQLPVRAAPQMITISGGF